MYKGLDSPLLFTENYHKARDENFHGSDGFGNVFTDKPDISRLKKEHAVYALQKISAEHYGKLKYSIFLKYYLNKNVIT